MMGNPKKKNKGGGGGGGEGKKKLGTRKRLQLEKLQREENERKADKAIVAGLKKMAERGITESSNMFAPIPSTEDCSICLVPLSIDGSETVHMDCCGKIICIACDDAWFDEMKEANAAKKTKKQPLLPFSCAFCRTPYCKHLARMMKHVESKDTEAMYNLARRYRVGEYFEKDEQKAFDLTVQAAELGNMKAFNELALYYSDGKNLHPDMLKYRVCLDASARAGNYMAHLNLGDFEYTHNGNYALAVRHYQVAAGAGYKPALDKILEMLRKGLAWHYHFRCAIEAYKKAKEDQSSEERTKWAEKKKKAKGSSTSDNTTA